jgi:hypothetical protein
MIEITNQYMSLKVDGKVVATALFSQYAAADGNGAWIVSTHSARLFTRDQAITALTVAELGESGYPYSHPLLVAPRGVAVTDRLIRLTTTLAVVAVANVAAGPANWPRPVYREHGCTRFHPPGTPYGRPRRGQEGISRYGARRPDGNSRRHRPRRKLSRFRRRQLHHRPAHNRRRRPQPRHLTCTP